MPKHKIYKISQTFLVRFYAKKHVFTRLQSLLLYNFEQNQRKYYLRFALITIFSIFACYI